jgi:hypothetical protein
MKGSTSTGMLGSLLSAVNRTIYAPASEPNEDLCKVLDADENKEAACNVGASSSATAGGSQEGQL